MRKDQAISLFENASAPGVDRALAILELIGCHRSGITASEIAGQLTLPLNSVMRILETMQQRGWLARAADESSYLLTNRVTGLYQPHMNDKSLVVCVWDALKKLRDATGETAQLVTLVENKIVVLAQAESDQAIKVSGRIGMRVPAFSCAPGKAILASLPEDQLQKYYQAVTLKAYTATTRSTKQMLDEDLEAIRKRGYATDLAEGLDGIHCVAVALFDENKIPIGALTVMGPMFRVKKSMFPELGKHCLAAAVQSHEQLWAQV